MSNPPAPDTELFDLAAKLTGFETLDLLHVVQRADGSLVVILATDQKYVFNPEQIAAAAVASVETQMEQLVTPKPPKGKKTA